MITALPLPGVHAAADGLEFVISERADRFPPGTKSCQRRC